MNKDFIIRKLTSRKFWLAVAAFTSGLIVALGGEKTTAETVSGVILQGAAVVGYLLAEGLTDAASNTPNDIYITAPPDRTPSETPANAPESDASGKED